MPFSSTLSNPFHLVPSIAFRRSGGYLVAAALLIVASVASAQITEFSPFSRNGFGLLYPTTSTSLLGMGGAATAAAPSSSINMENPASIAGLLKTTLEVGGVATLQQLRLGVETANGNFGNTSPVSLVVKRQGGKTAYNLGVSPFSTTGFAASTTYEADGMGFIRETYDGDGGLSQLQLGAARSFQKGGWIMAGATDSIQIQKHAIFLGARLRYVFGQIQRTTRLDILDPTFLDNRTRTIDQHRSAGIEIGMQYEWLISARYNAQQEFERSTSLRFGLTHSPQAQLSTDRLRIVETTQTLGGLVTPLDTAAFTDLTAAMGCIPAKTGFGLALNFTRGDGQRVTLTSDFVQQNWAGKANEQTVDLLTDDVSWGLYQVARSGIEWTPSNPAQRNNAWGRSTYRFGVAAGTLGMEFDGLPLIYESFSAGFSMPMLGSRSTSQFHFGTEVGTRHLGTENGLEENFIRLQFGFSLTPFIKNNWLVPRLYD
jgi:hypothetical protein